MMVLTTSPDLVTIAYAHMVLQQMHEAYQPGAPGPQNEPLRQCEAQCFGTPWRRSPDSSKAKWRLLNRPL